MPAERALDRGADLAVAELEHGIGDVSEQVAPGDRSQRDIIGVHTGKIGGDGGEIAPPRQLVARRPRRRLIGHQNLVHGTLLGLRERGPPVVVLGQSFFFGYRDLAHEILGRDVDERQRAVLGRREARGVLFVKGGERRVVGSRRGADRAIGHDEEIGHPPLLAVAVERLHQHVGGGDGGGQAADEVCALEIVAYARHKL